MKPAPKPRQKREARKLKPEAQRQEQLRKLSNEMVRVQTVDGRLVLHIDLKVGVLDMKDWPVERIEALFSGIAQAALAIGGILEDDKP